MAEAPMSKTVDRLSALPDELKRTVVLQLQNIPAPYDEYGPYPEHAEKVHDPVANEALSMAQDTVACLGRTCRVWYRFLAQWRRAVVRYPKSRGGVDPLYRRPDHADPKHLRVLYWEARSDESESESRRKIADRFRRRVIAKASLLTTLCVPQTSRVSNDFVAFLAALPGGHAQPTTLVLPCTSNSASLITKIVTRCTSLRVLLVQIVGRQNSPDVLALLSCLGTPPQLEHLEIEAEQTVQPFDMDACVSPLKRLRWKCKRNGTPRLAMRFASNFAATLEAFVYEEDEIRSRMDKLDKLDKPYERVQYERLRYVKLDVAPQQEETAIRLVEEAQRHLVEEAQDLLQSNSGGSGQAVVRCGSQDVGWLVQLLKSEEMKFKSIKVGLFLKSMPRQDAVSFEWLVDCVRETDIDDLARSRGITLGLLVRHVEYPGGDLDYLSTTFRAVGEQETISLWCGAARERDSVSLWCDNEERKKLIGSLRDSRDNVREWASDMRAELGINSDGEDVADEGDFFDPSELLDPDDYQHDEFDNYDYHFY